MQKFAQTAIERANPAFQSRLQSYISNIYMIDFDKLVGFDWDDGNSLKSLNKHAVTRTEAEQVFLNDPLIILEDTKHSSDERRFNALGRTFENRRLHMTFTLRQQGSLVRIISARDMNRKERAVYEKT